MESFEYQTYNDSKRLKQANICVPTLVFIIILGNVLGFFEVYQDKYPVSPPYFIYQLLEPNIILYKLDFRVASLSMRESPSL